MSVPTLPPGVPGLALRDGWGVSPIDPLRRTDMDDGAVALERRFHLVRTLYAIAWELNAAQFDLVQVWWADVLDGGTKWFLAPVVEGLRSEARQVRFTKPPAITSPACGIYLLTGEVETADLPRMTPAERMATEVWLTRAGDVQSIIDQLTAINAVLDGMEPWA